MSITKTRQKLVEVARELFARNGLDATTMNDIAVASKKGRRTLYTYFRNKEEIYDAVIEGEMERLSESMDEVAGRNMPPGEKIMTLLYTHLDKIKETVSRNGNLRAEFFRNIWLVEKVRRTFDEEEKDILQRVLEEGTRQGIFHIENVRFTAEIIHYALKGLEVPYIYDRLGEGLDEEQSRSIVEGMVSRTLGIRSHF